MRSLLFAPMIISFVSLAAQSQISAQVLNRAGALSPGRNSYYCYETYINVKLTYENLDTCSVKLNLRSYDNPEAGCVVLDILRRTVIGGNVIHSAQINSGVRRSGIYFLKQIEKCM